MREQTFFKMKIAAALTVGGAERSEIAKLLGISERRIRRLLNSPEAQSVKSDLVEKMTDMVIKAKVGQFMEYASHERACDRNAITNPIDAVRKTVTDTILDWCQNVPK